MDRGHLGPRSHLRDVVLHLPRHPRQVTLVLATAASAFGSGVAGLAFTYLAYRLSGSLVAPVVVLAAGTLPRLILVKPARVLPSVLGIRATVIGAQLVLLVLYAVAAFMVYVGYLSVPFLLVISVIVGSVAALDYPAWNQMLRQSAASSGPLVSLDAALQSGSAVAHIAGTLAGGALLVAWGPTSLFVINAVSYLFPAAAVWGLGPLVAVAGDGKDLPSVWSTTRFLFADDRLRRVVGASILVLLLAWPLLKLLPAVASDVYASPMTFALLLSAFYVGGAITPLVVRYGRRLPYDVMLERSVVVMTSALVLILASAFVATGLLHLVVLMLLLVPMGLALTTSSTIFAAAVQTAAPGARESEILAAYAAVIAVAAPVGALVVCGIGGRAGVWWAIAFEAVGVALFVVILRWKVRPVLREADGLDADHGLLRRLSHRHGDPDNPHDGPLTVRRDGVA